MEEEAPNMRNEVAILTDHVLVLILSYLTTAPCAAASVSVYQRYGPGITIPPVYMTTTELSVQQPSRGGLQGLTWSTNMEIKASRGRRIWMIARINLL
jgi:hypothetical protein